MPCRAVCSVIRLADLPAQGPAGDACQRQPPCLLTGSGLLSHFHVSSLRLQIKERD